MNGAARNTKWQAELASPPGAALLALGMMLLFVLLMLAGNGWDAKIFIFEGSLYSRSEPDGTIGYDGQFAYYIALDPLHAAPKIDEPAYRYQRILYPALAWLVSLGGDPALLPWVLVSINILALTAAVYLLAEYLGEQSANPLYAISFLAFIGTILTLWADLNEPLALAFSLWGLRFTRRNRVWQAGLAFALGILAKEIALMFALGAAAWCLVTRRFTHAARLIALSLAPAVAWGFVLTRWLGESPLAAQPAAMEVIPFYGMKFLLAEPVSLFILAWTAFPAAAALMVGLCDRRRWSAGPEALVLLANTALVALMPRLTWINIAGALRLSLGLLAASLLFTARYYPTRLKWVSVFWAASGPALLLLSPWLF